MNLLGWFAVSFNFIVVILMYFFILLTQYSAENFTVHFSIHFIDYYERLKRKKLGRFHVAMLFNGWFHMKTAKFLINLQKCRIHIDGTKWRHHDNNDDIKFYCIFTIPISHICHAMNIHTLQFQKSIEIEMKPIYA